MVHPSPFVHFQRDCRVRHPKTAYILLWFPKPSETFIFREVVTLRKLGLPLKVYTLYGSLKKWFSPEMQSFSGEVERLGWPYLRCMYKDIYHWLRKDHKKVIRLLKAILFKHWYGFEKTGENLWAFLCAFQLARRFLAEKVEHIHAPWACGPATAAWVASGLTGIPFSFTARAWDIYPPDGVLREKIRDATLVRSETEYNIRYLEAFSRGADTKIHLTYNGVPVENHGKAPVIMRPPYQLLALGRLVGKKGYDYLLQACRILKDAGLPFRLTLAGDGPMRWRLKRLARKLGLSEWVIFTGFVSHDRVPELFHAADIFVMPSIVHSSDDRDGIPTVLMESLLYCVPVIATDVSGISELIENGQNGLLIPEKDPDAISRAVVNLKNNRENAIRMAEQGHRTIQSRFNPDINGQRVLSLFQKKFSSTGIRFHRNFT